MSDKDDILDVKVFFSSIIEKDTFYKKATAVSSENGLGRFDILPQHINFITLIFKELTIHTEDKEKVSYQFERGVLEVQKNEVNIFLGL